MAIFGNDEAVRNGGAGSKEWKEVGVVSQSSFRHPRRRRTLFRRAQGTEYRLKCVWGVASPKLGCTQQSLGKPALHSLARAVGSVHLDRQNAERVLRLTLSRNGVWTSLSAHRGEGWVYNQGAQGIVSAFLIPEWRRRRRSGGSIDERETCRANLFGSVWQGVESPVKRPLAKGWRRSLDTLSFTRQTDCATCGFVGWTAMELTAAEWSAESMPTRPKRTILSARMGV